MRLYFKPISSVFVSYFFKFFFLGKVKLEPDGKLGQINCSTIKNERTDDNYSCTV